MTDRLDNQRVVRAPHGTAKTCRRWTTESALRMLMNNLDPITAAGSVWTLCCIG